MELPRCHYCGAVSYRQKVCADNTSPNLTDTMHQQKRKTEIVLYEPYVDGGVLKGLNEQFVLNEKEKEAMIGF